MLDRTATTLQPTKTLYLMLTDSGRCLSRNFRGEFGIHSHNQWSWIVGSICGEFDCEPEQVSCIETEDGDKIALDGVAVAELIEE